MRKTQLTAADEPVAHLRLALVATGLAALSVPAAAAAQAAPHDAAPDKPSAPKPSPQKPGHPTQTLDDDGDEAVGVSEVVVSGLRPLMGDKIPLSRQDVPQSVDVIPKALMQQQAVTRLEDALRNVPGVTLNAGEGAARGDTINIRGFSAFNDFFLDGIRDAAVYVRDPFDLESVEVVKGPSATLFGRGSTGGAVNQVGKAPTLDPLRELTLEAATSPGWRATADIDQPIGPSAAIRLNLLGESSHVADRDDVRSRHWGVAPTIGLGLGKPTTLDLAYLHLDERDRPDVGVPFVDGAPAPVNRSNDYGLTADHANSIVDVGTARLTHDFGGGVTLADTLRVARYAYDYLFDAPNFGDSPPTAGEPLSSILVGRDSPSSGGVQTNLTDQLDLTLRFATGPIRHTLVIGAEATRQTNDLHRYANPFDTDPDWVPQTPLLDPDPNEPRPASADQATTLQRTVADSESLYATDTMKLGDRLDLIAGVRLDRFAASYAQRSLTTGASLDLAHTDLVGSPRAALIYKPASWASLYVSYGTSFDPSAEALTLTTRTANLGPVKATSYEAGARASVLNGGLLLTGAVFHTQVDNAQVNDPDNPTLTILQGRERVQGFELGATGRLTARWEITAGYTWLDGATSGDVGSAPVIAYQSQRIPNLARNQVDLWTEYDVTSAFEVGIGLNYLDRRIADVVTPLTPAAWVPSYVVWNAMAAWKVDSRLSVQLNAINLFDRTFYDGVYYTSQSENHVIPGPGRTVKLTLRTRF